MADPTEFPHLKWAYEGPFEAVFQSNPKSDPEVDAIKKDPGHHAGRLRGDLVSMRRIDEQTREARSAQGLPEIRGNGFLLRVPEGTDVDALAYALGIELVAETEHGLMFAASNNLSLERLEHVLTAFEISLKGTGGSNAARVLDVFYAADDGRKLDELLTAPVRPLWPFQDEVIYTFDLGIQTASSTRSFKWSKAPRKSKDQTEEEHRTILKGLREKDRARANEEWMDAAEERFGELNEIIVHYSGHFLTGYSYDEPREKRRAFVFPDSIQVRVRMSGKGFRDLVENFPHLFEVSFPEDIKFLPGSPQLLGIDGSLTVEPPDEASAVVCVIDSGMQEGHPWLAAAVDTTSSKCFLPERNSEEVADYVAPRGHGTRVAGAVLYPQEIPKSGTVRPVAWIQNARVLDESNSLPITLPPEVYLTSVIEHFHGGPRSTKLFNHSISDSAPCQTRRMCKWAARIDHLSHQHDVLFIQSAGNVTEIACRTGLSSGMQHPSHLLDGDAGVASPAQSLHALTVGSVARSVVSEDGWHSFARVVDAPSAFSRAGYAPPWTTVKPEVVEYGGDFLHQIPPNHLSRTSGACAPELLASTLHGQPAISADDVGTSFAAPKVAHIAAVLQNLFPTASPQLYRALIVQSARWPDWAAGASSPDEVLKLIGYGIPSVERATQNTSRRVTLITPNAVEIQSKQFHLYQIPIPDEIRRAALECQIRIDVTLAYTSTPRRTRARRIGYLETWLDWRTIHEGEPFEHFRERMKGRKLRTYPGFRWKIHQGAGYGDVEETARGNGSVQKDWTVVKAHQMPENFAIAVRAHVGWNHKEGAGPARYCLAVSFESLDLDLPVYAAVRAELEVETDTNVRVEV